MFIGYLNVNLFIPHSRSLKDRRQVIERIKQKVRNNFNISVAQKPTDKWQTCELCFVYVNYTKSHVSNILDRLENFIRFNNDIHISEVEKEVL